MPVRVKIVVIPLIRGTFDVVEGQKIYQRELSFLKNIEHVDLVAPSQVFEQLTLLNDFLSLIYNEQIDGIILFSATFHLGDLALAVSSAFPRTPILCWAVPEPPYTGTKIRLNSLVGAHLDFCNLYKTGRKDILFAYGSCNEENFRQELSAWIDALRVVKGWKGGKIGLVGGHAPTFIDVDIYEPDLFATFGLTIEFLSQETLLEIGVHQEIIEKLEKDYIQIYDNAAEIDAEKLKKVATLTAAFENCAKTQGYTAMAVRCWPEFADRYGISPCAAISYNLAQGLTIACEGDVGGAITMLAFKSLGCNEVYLADVSQIFEQEKSVLLWHCGVAPHTLWDGKSQRTLDTYFAGGKGVTVGFVLKTGLVTIARIDYIRNHWQLFLAKGEALPTGQELKGTYVKVKVSDPLHFLKTLINNGFAHHVVVAYGDYTRAFQKLAQIKGWAVYEVTCGKNT